MSRRIDETYDGWHRDPSYNDYCDASITTSYQINGIYLFSDGRCGFLTAPERDRSRKFGITYRCSTN